MSFDKVIVFVVLVSLSAFDGAHADISLVEPAGIWYVVATYGYNDALPVPKCWTINISEPLKDGNFEGDSDFMDKSTSQRYHAHFRAILYTERSSLDNMYHRFELVVTIGENETISVDSIALYQFVTSQGTADLSNMTISGQTWKYFEHSYISRTAVIDSNITLLLAHAKRVDNSNCLSTTPSRTVEPPTNA